MSSSSSSVRGVAPFGPIWGGQFSYLIDGGPLRGRYAVCVEPPRRADLADEDVVVVEESAVCGARPMLSLRRVRMSGETAMFAPLAAAEGGEERAPPIVNADAETVRVCAKVIGFFEPI